MTPRRTTDQARPAIGAGARRLTVDPSRTHALVVTVERYQSPDVSDIPGLAASGRRFTRWLAGRGVPEENVIFLGDSGTGLCQADQVTVDRVLTEQLPDRDGDLLWLLWVGHGVLDPLGRRRLLLADATTRNLRTVDLDALMRLYRTSFLAGFRRQIIVADACQSDLPLTQSARWPEPMSLPPGGERTLGSHQYACLAAAPGEAARYADGRPLFTEAFLDELERRGHGLADVPGYDAVEKSLVRKYRETGQETYFRQHPVTLRFVSGDGTVREGDVTPAERPSPFRRDSSGSLVSDPLLAAYLRWLTAIHGHTEALVAGTRVRAPIARAPWPGDVVPDGSDGYARRRETQYLESRLSRLAPALRDEATELAARPLPTHLTHVAHVDRLDLSGREHRSALDLPDTVWRCVVLGDPGSGKTTLARRFATRVADLDSMTADPLWRLPVLCRAVDLGPALGRQVAEPDGDEPDFATVAGLAIALGWSAAPPTDPLSGDRIDPAGLARVVTRAAGAGRLLLIIDGLDELPTREDRAGLVKELNGLVDRDGSRYGLPGREPGNQLFVTSRFIGYYATELADNVQQMILRPMEAGAAAATGAFWLDHYAATAGIGRARAKALTQQLHEVMGSMKDEGDGNRRGGSVPAANPYLLVSLVSAVASGELTRLHRRGTGVTRADLYAFMVEDALHRATGRFPGTRPETLLGLQAAVAYRLHRTSRTGVLDRSALESCVSDALGDLPPGDRPSPERALELLQGLGLMSQRGQGLYGFLHLTLEEYLAGHWLMACQPVPRIREHLGDPRWVEPMHLGLARLGSTDRAALDSLLTDLLTGPDGHRAALLPAACLRELGTVRDNHVRLSVAAVLRPEVPSAFSHRALAALLSLPAALPGARRPADLVGDALADALSDPSAPVRAAAAAATEALGLYTRRTAQALYRAQWLDSPESGWPAVRALQAMEVVAATKRRTGSAPGPREVANAWAGLSEEDRNALPALSVAQPDGRTALPLGEPPPRSPLADSLVPLREALIADGGARAERLAASPGLLRVVLCLYGGLPFHDTQRWRGERARLEAELLIADAGAAARRDAAVRLDTVVVPALARQNSVPDRVDPRHMTADSPLTPHVLRWLDDATPERDIAARLRLIRDDTGADAALRGDAVAALVMLGAGAEGAADTDPLAPVDAGRSSEQPPLSRLRQAARTLLGSSRSAPRQEDSPAALLPDDVRDRLTWRLRRAAYLLADATSRVTVGSLVTDLADQGVQGAELSRLGRAATRALVAVSGQAPTPGGLDSRLGPMVRESLVWAVCSAHDSKTYNLAVMLDTQGRVLVGGDPANLIWLLGTAHLTAADYPGYRDHWNLDPLAPGTGTSIGDALTALDGLAAPYTFLRCWLLDRLAPLLVPAGYAVEALCLALRFRPEDEESVDATVRRYMTLAAGFADRLSDPHRPADAPELPGLLTSWAQDLDDPLLRGRALLHVARLRQSRLGPQMVTTLTEGVADPTDRLRLCELAVSLGLQDWTPDLLARARACGADIADPSARALAEARLDRAGPRLRTVEGRRQPRSPAEETFPPAPVRAEADSGEPWPGTAIATELLRSERLSGASPSAAADGRPRPLAWTVFTSAVLCADALAALDPGSWNRWHPHSGSYDAAQHWRVLLDPARRDAAAGALLRHGRVHGLPLDATACDVLDALLVDGRSALVAELLAVGRLTAPVPQATAWRSVDDERIADLATLLAIELGELDVKGVGALPRLLTHEDSRVRIRTGLATATISRGGDGPPRLNAARLGPETLVALARATAAARHETARISSDLSWALSDVVHNAPDTLERSLMLLNGEPEARAELLRIARITPDALFALPGFITRLPEADRLRVLACLQGIALRPERSGVSRFHIAQLAAPLERLADGFSGRLLSEVLALSGLVLPTDAESLRRLTSYAAAGSDPYAADAGPAALGATIGLGALLKRFRQDDPHNGVPETEEAARDGLLTLRALAAAPDEDLAAAAVTGLSRLSDDDFLDEGLASGTIDALVLLWGRLGALDPFVVGPDDRWSLERIARFVRRPRGLSGADAAHHTDVLTRALLDRATQLRADAGRPESLPLSLVRSGASSCWDVLGVLVALARSQPAALRLLVEEAHPEFPTHLLHAAQAAPPWLGREFATRLLVLLGRGDATTVRTVLDTVADTDMVRQGVLDELRWFDRIEDDGLDVLLETVTGPRLERCYLAVQILLSLLRHRVLQDRDHTRALDAVQRAADRSDSDRALLAERDGDIVSPGTFADLCRTELDRLLGATVRRPSPRPAEPIVRLETSDTAGRPVTLLAPGDGAGAHDQQALEHQIRYLRDVEGRALPEDVRSALSQAMRAAHETGVLLTDLLRRSAESA